MQPTIDDRLPFVLWFDDVRATELARVGGKNASLADMTRSLASAGVPVPPGFAVTVEAYARFVEEAGLLDVISTSMRAMRDGRATLQQTGAMLRRRMREAAIPDVVRAQIVDNYRALCRREGVSELAVAVRSSATAEDLPTASFAGQQESFLHVQGEHDVLRAWRDCVASLFTDRAIAYRDEHHIDHAKVALSVGVQRMVRSDLASAGVMFTLDTETGFPDVVLVTASWGLGENIVQGAISPDEFLLYKPALHEPTLRPLLRARIGSKERTMVLAQGGRETTRNVDTPRDKRRRACITDDEVLQLARWAVRIEEHASQRAGHPTPMDIEWAKDGVTGALFIVQARPETVHARNGGVLVRDSLLQEGTVVVRGRAVGARVAVAPVCVIRSVTELARFPRGAILVAPSTDPDWVPAMRIAAGIITEHGGRTCHAAIVARELGLPAIVAADDATTLLRDGQVVTLSCAHGEEGRVYDGALQVGHEEIDVATLPTTRTKIMINLADPSNALSWWRLPTDGIGLARMEFIIAEDIGVHPMALVHPERVVDDGERTRIAERTRGFKDGSAFFIDRLARGIATIAASQAPRAVVVRMSDFKTNEYASLLGGRAFEPVEENPMIGFRGASRYDSPLYREAFVLECRALKKVRDEIGLRNVVVMIPFCRTLREADRVLAVMAEAGLRRGVDGLQVYVMCEIPSNVVLATEFAARFDGFSIGSNDLTQLVLGVDRDSALLADVFDERDPAVTRMIADAIARAHGARRHIGICGQGPSDHPDFAAFLVEQGIDSLSLNPDSFVAVKRHVAAIEARSSQRRSSR